MGNSPALHWSETEPESETKMVSERLHVTKHPCSMRNMINQSLNHFWIFSNILQRPPWHRKNRRRFIILASDAIYYLQPWLGWESVCFYTFTHLHRAVPKPQHLGCSIMGQLFPSLLRAPKAFVYVFPCHWSVIL